jgi:hypothetical protein
MSKTPASYKRGSIKVEWLGRVCMAQVRAGSLLFMQTTTTAVPDGGSHSSSSFTYLSATFADTLFYYASIHDGCTAFEFWATNASAYQSVYNTEMPGVYEWGRSLSHSLALARCYGTTLPS